MLGPLLSGSLEQYPAIDLEISVDAASTDIVAGRFDAGMRAGDRVERDMIAVRIGEEIRGVAVAAPDYLARRKRPMTPQDLGAHNCIRFRFPSGVILPWKFGKKGKRVEVAMRGRLTVNDPELAVKAALDGVKQANARALPWTRQGATPLGTLCLGFVGRGGIRRESQPTEQAPSYRSSDDQRRFGLVSATAVRRIRVDRQRPVGRRRGIA